MKHAAATGEQDDGARREIVTPEGVPLHLSLADIGDRAGAFAMDMVFIIGVVLALFVLAGLAAGADLDGSWIGAFVLIVSFLLRNFYFAFFEIRWHGSTPGKRLFGVRVTDRRGGPLTADAVIARNLVRDVEVFLPIQIIAAPELVWPGADGRVMALASVWVFVLMLMPLFNRDRMRIGDLVGGTIVVRAPSVMLLPDLGAGAGAAAPTPDFSFSPEQLAIYGIYELQVLEDVLRGDPAHESFAQSIELVCERIKTKIGWSRDHWKVDEHRFLSDFYAALRARLEKDLLLGKRQDDKFSRPDRS